MPSSHFCFLCRHCSQALTIISKTDKHMVCSCANLCCAHLLLVLHQTLTKINRTRILLRRMHELLLRRRTRSCLVVHSSCYILWQLLIVVGGQWSYRRQTMCNVTRRWRAAGKRSALSWLRGRWHFVRILQMVCSQRRWECSYAFVKRDLRVRSCCCRRRGMNQATWVVRRFVEVCGGEDVVFLRGPTIRLWYG